MLHITYIIIHTRCITNQQFNHFDVKRPVRMRGIMRDLRLCTFFDDVFWCIGFPRNCLREINNRNKGSPSSKSDSYSSQRIIARGWSACPESAWIIWVQRDARRTFLDRLQGMTLFIKIHETRRDRLHIRNPVSIVVRHSKKINAR